MNTKLEFFGDFVIVLFFFIFNYFYFDLVYFGDTVNRFPSFRKCSKVKYTKGAHATMCP